MAKRSSSSMEVLLGILTIEPMSGYDLGQMIRTSVGFIWNESYGQIYPNLKKLAAEGCVTAKTERQKGKPDKRIYSITAKGRERLAAWLAVEPQPEIARNELLLKLFFGAQISPEISIQHVEQMMKGERAFLREFRRIELEEISNNQQYPDAPYWKMAARFGQLELEAHQRWCEETLDELRKIAKQQRKKSERGKGRIMQENESSFHWLLWAPLVAAAAHIFEEFVWPGGFMNWYRRYHGENNHASHRAFSSSSMRSCWQPVSTPPPRMTQSDTPIGSASPRCWLPTVSGTCRPPSELAATLRAWSPGCSFPFRWLSAGVLTFCVLVPFRLEARLLHCWLADRFHYGLQSFTQEQARCITRKAF